ncbi:hypothetical protein FIBSPDRAFT_901700 [Athelia psychrophila]|uniref:Uncharacterized protein n=1 Tax=Athelia psychrophila TaxID=1759441 RepID=A0A165WSW2_9AGAM|nr:hypothetical protein FIBSPDRAFT_901700 [Fibularhizoctonia sp. CBS 109695]
MSQETQESDIADQHDRYPPLPSHSITAVSIHDRPLPLRLPVTPYRLLNIVVLLGLGIPKAVYSAKGQSVTAGNLDWALGLFAAVIMSTVVIMNILAGDLKDAESASAPMIVLVAIGVIGAIPLHLVKFGSQRALSLRNIGDGALWRDGGEGDQGTRLGRRQWDEVEEMVYAVLPRVMNVSLSRSARLALALECSS